MDSSLPVRIISASEPDDAMPQSIDETGIRRLVHGFYDAIRRDPLLGPIFDQAIAPERWPGHLEKMCAFWSSVLLKTRRYDGRPLPPHLALADLSDSHFQRWLELFRSTAGEVFDADGAAVIVSRAERIAHSFRLALSFHRGENTTTVMPLSSALKIGEDLP
jgi:hemoglobin